MQELIDNPCLRRTWELMTMLYKKQENGIELTKDEKRYWNRELDLTRNHYFHLHCVWSEAKKLRIHPKKH